VFLPVKISLGAGGDERVIYDRSIELTAKQLTAFGHEAGNMREPLSMIGRDLRAQIEAAFATEGASGASGHWVALSPDYQAWKQKHGNPPLLIGVRPIRKGTRGHPTRPQSYTTSGRMRMQLLDPLATHITSRRLLYAPQSDIAGYHETGTSRMPARPPVDLSLTFLHSIDRTFAAWIAGLTDKLGLTGPGSG
jgi:hypothetical protein